MHIPKVSLLEPVKAMWQKAWEGTALMSMNELAQSQLVFKHLQRKSYAHHIGTNHDLLTSLRMIQVNDDHRRDMRLQACHAAASRCNFLFIIVWGGGDLDQPASVLTDEARHEGSF